MTRITNAMKDHIVQKALEKSGITAALAAEKEKRFDWIERARIEVLGGKAKAKEYDAINAKFQKQYDDLPRDLRGIARSLINESSTLRLNLAGANLRLKMRGYAVAPSDQRAITADNPLCQEFYNLEAELESLNKRNADVRFQVRATIDKFGTVKRLLEAWPEAKELLPAEAPQAKSQLPAVPVADLNKLVGLPSEQPAN